MRTRRLLIVVLCAAVADPCAPAAAQDRPVVFVHGMASSGGTWQQAAARLQTRMAITAYRPSLPWQRSLAEQAGALQAQLGGLPATAIAVGHSNGGLVSRQWSRLHRLDGLLTISTPHRGAPLFAHVGDWIDFNYMAFTFIAGIGSAFGASYDDSWWIYAAIQGVLSQATQGAQDAILQLAGLVGFQSGLPIFPQMIPGSPALSDINSSGSLGREAGSVRVRVGVVDVATNFYRGGVFRAIWPESGDAISNGLHASAALLDYYAMQLWTSPYPRDWQRAEAISNLAWWFWSHEELWCRTISDPSPSAYSSIGYCAENDTLVPTWSQVYPGAVNLERRNAPAHRLQTQNADSVIQYVLTTFMQVPLRGAAPPAPPPPGPPGPPTQGPRDTLDPGESLSVNDELLSADGRFDLVYQADGNLVLYRSDGRPLWASQTSGTSVGRAEMQTDGNLVIYDARDVPVWASDTSGNPGAALTVQRDGNVVIYSTKGTPVWATNTAGW